MTLTLQPCGTTGAYKRHIRHGEPTCQPCRDANTIAHRHPYVRSPSYHPASERIVDYLETFGSMTILELTWLVQRRHDVSYLTLKRTVMRMIGDGRLTAVKDLEGRLRVEVPC